MVHNGSGIARQHRARRYANPSTDSPRASAETERSRVLLKQSSSLQLVGRIILVAILVLLAIWILRRFLPALAWAGVLAIATWPVREWLTRKYMSELSSAILLTFAVGMLIVGPLVILAIQIAREAVILV